MPPEEAAPSLQLFLFRVEGQPYALHLRAVERVLPMVALTHLPGAPAIALGVVNLHGRAIPVLDIRRRFGLPPGDYTLSSRLLVARTRRRSVALPVDEAIGVREVPAGSVTPPRAVLPGIEHVAGIVTLAEGILFIHDLDTFLSLEEEQGLAGALVGSAEDASGGGLS